MAAGLQNKEIAQKLDLSLATVRNHIHNTLEKLEGRFQARGRLPRLPERMGGAGIGPEQELRFP